LDDRRLIEDYLPIQAISAQASREKSVRKGHISTLHLWWARRPLVACRAAVYGALVPADQWVQDVPIENANGHSPEAIERWKKGTVRGLNRAKARDFVTALCKYPGDPRVIEKAQGHILDAHADRLTAELAEGRKTGKMPAWVEEFKFKGDKVTRQDIEAGRAPRPRVLDMFAGGGAIPLEALRLGCEAYALDLNPVAHIIELCTLVYPQKYGRPDPSARGMTGPRNTKGATTWGGLAEEVRYWGNWVLQKVRAEIGDLYPPVPDPAVWDTPPQLAFDRETGQWNVTKPGKPKHGVKLDNLTATPSKHAKMFADDKDEHGEGEPVSAPVQLPPGFLQPIAYIWTRTVRCKNPACGAVVPLLRSTLLCKKDGRNVAVKIILAKEKVARFSIVESTNLSGLGFDPWAFSAGGNATCPWCGTVADLDYVKEQGWSGRIGHQMLATACTKLGRTGKVYKSPEDVTTETSDFENRLRLRLTSYCKRTNLTVPDEPIANLPSDSRKNTLGITVRPYGCRVFADLFSSRQLIFLISLASSVVDSRAEMTAAGIGSAHAVAVRTYLGLLNSTLADWNCAHTRWINVGEKLGDVFARQAIPMVWDYAELQPFGNGSGNARKRLANTCGAIELFSAVRQSAVTQRGSATSPPWPDEFLDAVVTDPPYYDNVPYADIADFFYVWLKRSIGTDHPEHFATSVTPKKGEAIADADRHGGSWDKATEAYEGMMGEALKQACRQLKPNGELVVVYAHKTTLGWSTLVDALRRAGFNVVEAWPLDTEKPGRVREQESAALASSIFLVARKREAEAGVGSYETDVRPDLDQIVRERVKTLWEMDISGADLVIACVGAGLRAFTKYARVEFANGEEAPAERFLMEVETVVLETILARLSKEVGGNGSRSHGLGGVDPATRFYILWRYTYRLSELDAGEAIIFANGTHVELDGQHGLCAGGRALVEKKKSKYRLRDYSERGDDERLGMPAENGQTAPLVDVLHRVLWLMENRPGQLEEFFRDARPNLEQVRLVAQALAGPALKGGELGEVSPSKELAALKILTSNWRSIAEAAGPLFGQNKST
jgi:putative DNA methylase